MRWGDRHFAPGGPPVLIEHDGCGGKPTPALVCDACGEEVGAAEAHPLMTRAPA
jgi:hypothetical protein